MTATINPPRATRVPFSKRKPKNAFQRFNHRVVNGLKRAKDWVMRQIKRAKARFDRASKFVRYPVYFVLSVCFFAALIVAFDFIAYLVAIPFLLVSELLGAAAYLVTWFLLWCWFFFLLFEEVGTAGNNKSRVLRSV